MKDWKRRTMRKRTRCKLAQFCQGGILFLSRLFFWMFLGTCFCFSLVAGPTIGADENQFVGLLLKLSYWLVATDCLEMMTIQALSITSNGTLTTKVWSFACTVFGNGNGDSSMPGTKLFSLGVIPWCLMSLTKGCSHVWCQWHQVDKSMTTSFQPFGFPGGGPMHTFRPLEHHAAAQDFTFNIQFIQFTHFTFSVQRHWLTPSTSSKLSKLHPSAAMETAATANFLLNLFKVLDEQRQKADERECSNALRKLELQQQKPNFQCLVLVWWFSMFLVTSCQCRWFVVIGSVLIDVIVIVIDWGSFGQFLSVSLILIDVIVRVIDWCSVWLVSSCQTVSLILMSLIVLPPRKPSPKYRAIWRREYKGEVEKVKPTKKPAVVDLTDEKTMDVEMEEIMEETPSDTEFWSAALLAKNVKKNKLKRKVQVRNKGRKVITNPYVMSVGKKFWRRRPSLQK